MTTPPSAPWARIAVGIDFNEETPILVKATRQGNKASLERIDSTLLTPPPPNSVIAGALLQKESFTRWLTAPIASAKKAELVFSSLLDVQLPFSIEDCEFAILHTRPSPDGTGTCGLIAGARTVDIEKRLATYSTLGLNPHLLDQEGIALWTQSLEECPFVSGSPELRVILYLSSDRATLSIGKNAEFLGAHTLRQLDADQIHRLLKSYAPTTPQVTQWFITGPKAILPETSESPLMTLANRWPGPMKLTREPPTFLARALATRALIPGTLRCNLRTGQFLHPALAQRQAKLPYQWAAACLVAGLLLCSLNAAWSLFVSHRAAGIQKAARSLAIEITGSPLGIPAGQELLAARRAMDTQTKAMEPFLAASSAPIAQALKPILLAGHAEGLSIDTLTINRQNVVIHGTAEKWAQPEATRTRLLNLGWLVTLERKDSAAGGDRVAFVIGLGRSYEKK